MGRHGVVSSRSAVVEQLPQLGAGGVRAHQHPDRGRPGDGENRLHQADPVAARNAELVAHLDVLGEQLAILADGAASRAMVFNDPAPLRNTRAAAEALLRAAG